MVLSVKFWSVHSAFSIDLAARRTVIVAAIYPKQGKLFAHPGHIVGWVHVDVPDRGNRCCICHRKRRRWGTVGRWVPVGGGPQSGFPTASAALKPPTRGHCCRSRGTIRSGCCLAVRAVLRAARVVVGWSSRAERLSFSFPFSVFQSRKISSRNDIRREPQSLAIDFRKCYGCDNGHMREMVCACDRLEKCLFRRWSQICVDEEGVVPEREEKEGYASRDDTPMVVREGLM